MSEEKKLADELAAIEFPGDGGWEWLRVIHVNQKQRDMIVGALLRAATDRALVMPSEEVERVIRDLETVARSEDTGCRWIGNAASEGVKLIRALLSPKGSSEVLSR